jgi:hypothetical protein
LRFPQVKTFTEIGDSMSTRFSPMMIAGPAALRGVPAGFVVAGDPARNH